MDSAQDSGTCQKPPERCEADFLSAIPAECPQINVYSAPRWRCASASPRATH